MGGQGAVVHEGLHADDGVVAPVVGFAELPELHAQREQPAGDARGELLGTGVQRDVADGLRGGLDDAGTRMGFHELGHGDDAVAAHHAVGVEDHHVLVVLAPAAAEIGHVAGLAVAAAGAQAVVHLDLRLVGVGGQHGAQFFPGGALGGGDLGVIAVGEHEDVEGLRMARGGHRFAGGAQAGEHRGHVLVADRHDDRGAGVGAQYVVADAFRRQGVAVAAQHHPEAHHGREEAGHHPGGEQGEEGELAVFEPGAVIAGLHAGEERRGQGAGSEGQQQEDVAALAGGALPGLLRRGGCRGWGGLAAIEAHQHGGADAVPEAAPGQRRHGAAMHGRCGERIGMAVFAQGAARRFHRSGVACATARHHGGSGRARGVAGRGCRSGG